ncbi:MAG: 1-acyl-sn-glycerol-3-phosphate acyltransferase [Lachnospiraceae bacterium]|nr:1-acyl-sn-glycerol-3-phosphate acyltransferase [Lachnospiraceae bacterium]
MNKETYETELEHLRGLFKEFGGVDSYTTVQAVAIFEQIYKIESALGLSVAKRDEFFEGICRIFNIELINMEDYKDRKIILVPNHVSEFDGLIFGSILPNMMVVAKSDWISNPKLNAFLDKLFTLVGLVRKDGSSGMNVLRKCIDHLMEDGGRAVNIFVQQTIADIDITKPEDVASGACLIAKKSGADIIPVYCEQASVDHPTRVVFGKPMEIIDKKDFGAEWIKCELALRDSISDPVARKPVLCEKHQKPISEREF